MLFKRLCLIISLLIVLLCGCSKDTAINSGEQDNNNYSKTEKNILDNDEEKVTNQKTQNSNESGNDYGNLMNGGYAVYKDGYIYYVNGIDIGETSDGKLYRVNSDWTETTKILDDKAKCINIVGDWIYYINESDDYKLYKVRKDGTQKMMLSEDKCTVMYVKGDMYVQGDWIYYVTKFWGDEGLDGKLYKVKMDGSSKQKISDNYAENIVVQDEWIYCLTETFAYGEETHKNYLHKIKNDGTEKVKISDEEMYKFILYDKWIYYINNERNICRVDINGDNKSIITKDEVLDFNTNGEWIYYCNLSDDEKLYRIKPDGSSKERMNIHRSHDIHIVGDWIYFTSVFAEWTEPYRIKLDGTEEALIEHPEVREKKKLEHISILNKEMEEQDDYSLSDEERIEMARSFNRSFENFLRMDYSIEMSDEEIKDRFPLISLVGTKTCPDSGINVRVFTFSGLAGVYGKSSKFTTFIQWWDDIGIRAGILYELDKIIVSDFMIAENKGNTNIILIGYVDLYRPAPFCFARWQLNDWVCNEIKAIDDIKADEDIWVIENSNSMVMIENKKMDSMPYKINKEQTGFKIYLGEDESKNLSFKIVGDGLVQE